MKADGNRAGSMRRTGLRTFLWRLVCSFTRGTFTQKLSRHILRQPLVACICQATIRAFCPVNPRRAVFATFAADCACNPKYIALELARRHPEMEIIWWADHQTFVRYRRGGAPGGGRAVQEWTLSALKAVMTAGVLVENAQILTRKSMPDKRPGQYCINTWHGSLGIKRLANAGVKFAQCLPRMRRMVDAVCVNSDFEDAVFEDSIFPGVPRLKVGHPRNDIFFLPEAEKAKIRARVRQTLGLAEGRHLALYAPTFRAEGFLLSAGRCDVAAWARALSDRFGGEWVVAVRLHPTDRRGMHDGLFRLPETLLDASDYEDMQELLVTAEAGVTDYSSWIFDYLLGGAPGFIYAPDREQYAAGRGLYYPLEETPFPIAEDEAGLCANIRAFDAARYAAERTRFLAARGCYERGEAAARTVDAIERVLAGGRKQGEAAR